jgi:hypothetical protein
MTNRGVLVAGATLVVATVLILGGVMRNRVGNPDAVARLGERELESWGDQSDGAETFLNLKLQWTTATEPDGKSWFDRAKLEALGNAGIPAAEDTAAHREWSRGTKQGYVVLELAGPAWERWVAAKQAGQDSTRAAQLSAGQEVQRDSLPWLESAGKGVTRLMAVDFGLDPLALREQYPERSQYLILPATYRMVVIDATKDSVGNITEPARIEGRIDQLLPGSVHVPRPLRDSLLGLGVTRKDSNTHFEVTLKVGKKWEAWIE